MEVRAEMIGTVWKITTGLGETVRAGDTLILLESMKMEIPVDAPTDGVVEQLVVSEGEQVSEGQLLVVLGS